MPQQINLCTGVLTTQRQRFTARTMLPALAVFIALGGALVMAGTWSLKRSADDYRTTLDAQSTEIKSLQAAITQSRANAAPVDPALVQQLQERGKVVKAREKVLAEVQQGLSRPGEGHSDRLLMVARSIPAQVWLTSVKVDSARFEVAGFTLEPAALNDWVARLATHPLMQDLKLSTVTVENTATAQVVVPATAVATPGARGVGGRTIWSFLRLILGRSKSGAIFF